MLDREIDYYIKGLSFDVRQEIWKRLDDINEIRVKQLLEKNEGYPAFRRMAYTDKDILTALNISTTKFQAVNDYMMENERYPLFTNSKDTYNSSLEYVELLRRKKKEELEEKFGCTWEEYIPKVYKKKPDKDRV